MPFVEYITQRNKPIILSTGVSTLDEVKQAVAIIRKNQKYLRNSEYAALTILHCTTNYPCSHNEVNLRAMQTLKDTFDLSVGYSDHTLGIEVSIAAAALGATVIEKHFTLDRNMKGPDHRASIEPQELKAMVRAVRNIEESLGSGIKGPTKKELEIMCVIRKGLVAARDLKKNEIMQRDMFTIKRPACGIQPFELKKVIGLRLKRDKKDDESLSWEDFK